MAAEIVLPCKSLDDTLHFFTEDLGFRLDEIYPADAPRVASVSGFGIRLRLDTGAEGDAGTLRLACNEFTADSVMEAPNGTRIHFAPIVTPPPLPPLDASLVVTRGGEAWGAGRAGMQYRDLIPDRWGGRYIASHIRIPDGGPVPDYVHHHNVCFQLIFCRNGWVRVVYEDQGPDFVMHAGDCVLQPPHIRHRVLECSDAMEVVEISCPAEHETLVDHALELPTATIRAERDFGGQKFVFSQAKDAAWAPWRIGGFECRDTGIAEATGEVASAMLVRAAGEADQEFTSHAAEFVFLFVLQGSAVLHCDGEYALASNDACAIPAGVNYRFADVSADFEMLEVTSPAT